MHIKQNHLVFRARHVQSCPNRVAEIFWDQCIVFWSQCLSSVLQAMIKIDLIPASRGIIIFCIQEHKSWVSWKCSNHSEWIVAKMCAGTQVQRRYTSWWTFTGHHNFLHKIHHNVADIAILLINLSICLRTRDERLNFFLRIGFCAFICAQIRIYLDNRIHAHVRFA